MSSSVRSKLSRRNFLKTTAATGAALVVRFNWAHGALAQEAKPQEKPRINPFDAWLRIDRQGDVTLIVPKSEMGQSVMTSLAMILADELEVDWKKVRVQHAETKPDLYDLGTGGSGSVLGSYTPLRQAGAAAREMLILAAAQTWGVDPKTCHAHDSFVIHNPRAHELAYGDLVDKASKLPVPDLNKVVLKNPDDFRYIGKEIPHIEIPSKIDGTAQFGIDVRVPGMLYAVIARSPVYGGKTKSFDATKAKAVPGVHGVVEIPAVAAAKTFGGIAVVADSSWAAMKGRDALQVEWDPGPTGSLSTASLSEEMQSLTSRPGTMIRSDGDVEAALGKGGRVIEAAYELPFEAHATMEPMNCTADVRGDRAEVWAPTQGPDWIMGAVAEVCGLKPSAVNVHTTMMGGAFGRRYHADFGVEAAQVSKAAGKPVQVLWTREDDIQHDFYRPAFHHRLAAVIDEQGNIAAWRHRLASTSIAVFWRPNPKPEESEIGGALWPPYAMSSFRIEYSPAKSGIPVMWWRSVEESSSGFVVESFIDELAAAAKTDPLEYRLRLIGTQPRTVGKANSPDDILLNTGRFRSVLQLAAEKAGWGKPVPSGHGLGIAAFYSFNTYAAHVADVSVGAGGKLRVHKITSAIDCGRAIDPNGVKAMTEGAVVYALSAMFNEITIEGGHAKQSNFDTYDVLRMRDMPQVDVYIVPSTQRPTGMGEPGLPPVAPAVTNAVFAATGKRLRRLPIRPADFA
jgi:isoquinoline 1-oxidoreductase subunit beta